MVKTRLEVGDMVLIEDLTRSNIVAITKVTDGKAIAEVKNRDGSKFDLRPCLGKPIKRVWFHCKGNVSELEKRKCLRLL